MVDVCRRSIKLEEREDHVGLTDQDQDQDQDQEVSKDGETLAEEVSDCDGPNESGDSVYVGLVGLEYKLIDWCPSVLPNWRKRTLSWK